MSSSLERHLRESAQSDGEPLWGQNKSSNGTANYATPLVFNNYVFSSSDYGTGAELVELKAQGNNVSFNPSTSQKT